MLPLPLIFLKKGSKAYKKAYKKAHMKSLKTHPGGRKIILQKSSQKESFTKTLANHRLLTPSSQD